MIRDRCVSPQTHAGQLASATDRGNVPRHPRKQLVVTQPLAKRTLIEFPAAAATVRECVPVAPSKTAHHTYAQSPVVPTVVKARKTALRGSSAGTANAAAPPAKELLARTMAVVILASVSKASVAIRSAAVNAVRAPWPAVAVFANSFPREKCQTKVNAREIAGRAGARVCATAKDNALLRRRARFVAWLRVNQTWSVQLPNATEPALA